jgi:hypothetical protein
MGREAPEPVSTFWRRRTSLTPAGTKTLCSPVIQPPSLSIHWVCTVTSRYDSQTVLLLSPKWVALLLCMRKARVRNPHAHTGYLGRFFFLIFPSVVADALAWYWNWTTTTPFSRPAQLVMIYLLTSIGLTPGGSSTVHIYTQTIHRTTEKQYVEQHKKQYVEQHKNVWNCAGRAPSWRVIICLTTEEKARKNLS